MEPTPLPEARAPDRNAAWLWSAAMEGALAYPVPGPGDEEDEDETPTGDPDDDDWEGDDWDEDDDEPIHAGPARQIAPANRR